VTVTIIGGIVGVLALGLVALLVVGGLFVPARYLDAWDRAAIERLDDPRMQLVAHGLLAPSGHNMQPWIVHLDPSDPLSFDVYADPERLTPAVDPLARQTMVSVGTFLEYLRVAGDRLGWRLAIDLFPDGAYDEATLKQSMAALPAARVSMVKAPPAPAGDYDSLFLADTNRDPYTAAQLTAAQRSALTALAAERGPSLQLLDGREDREWLAEHAVRGTTIEAGSAAAEAETEAVFRSNEWQKNEHPWGFAVEGQGTSGFMKYLMQGLLTLFPGMNEGEAAAQRSIDLTTSEVAATPAYAIIRTTGNSRPEQVEAGMLYASFQLRARTLGLVVQPLSQVLEEYPAMEPEYAAVHERFAPDGSTIQMIARVGTPTREYPTSMRRNVEDLLR
jgi:hypothetical protein